MTRIPSEKIITPSGNEIIYSFNTYGQVTLIPGSAQYPVQYSYDLYGKMTELVTWRNNPGSPASKRCHYLEL